MNKLSHDDLIIILISMGVMLIAGRLLGEAMRKIKMPIVIGEILAGIILGPTILGVFWPEAKETIFPVSAHSTLVLDGFAKVSVILLVFIAGLEVELSVVRKQGKRLASISMFSLIVPLTIGFLVPWYWPDFFGIPENKRLIFSLFFGTAMSITALPVIARILMDLNLFKSEIGVLIISAAMLDDIMGWMLFSVVLAMNDPQMSQLSVAGMLAKSAAYLVFMLTIGRWTFNRILPWVHKNFTWPGGVLSLAISFCLLAASVTEFFGIHGIFGSFLLGVAFSSSFHFSDKAKEILHHFVNNIFAPLFFVSIGLKINFSANFDLQLTMLIIGIAFVAKFSGVMLGSLISGFNVWHSLAISSGMNARGAMEILLATLAFQAGIIDARIYVAIVIMALVTSLMSGPMMKFFLRYSPAKMIKEEKIPVS